MEERRTAELMSDFDDYEIADGSDVSESLPADDDATDEPRAHSDKAARKKKKSR
jgi:hypothetical protein